MKKKYNNLIFKIMIYIYILCISYITTNIVNKSADCKCINKHNKEENK